VLHKLWAGLLAAMESWHQGKLFIEHSLSFSHDSIHILAGVLIWLAAGLLVRRPLSSWSPWLCVLALILWNETVDLTLEVWPDAGWQYGESFKDLLLTMSVPTLLMVATRLRPDLFRGGVGRRRR
jgi:hypothetical protein